MGCEDYRICLMALLDGEVSDAEREEIENHLGSCYPCHEEYENYRHIHEITRMVIPAAPAGFTWSTYYSGVCSKMQSEAGWVAWSLVSGLLVISGSFMIFGFTDSILSIVAGMIAYVAGGAIAALGFYCNCSSR